MDNKPETAASSCAITSTELLGAWISTKERLPKDGQIVAFIIDPAMEYYGGSVCAGRFKWEEYGLGQHPAFNMWGFGGLQASYWMPLPDAPNPSCLGTGHLVHGTQHNIVGLED